MQKLHVSCNECIQQLNACRKKIHRPAQHGMLRPSTSKTDCPCSIPPHSKLFSCHIKLMFLRGRFGPLVKPLSWEAEVPGRSQDRSLKKKNAGCLSFDDRLIPGKDKARYEVASTIDQFLEKNERLDV